MLPYLGKAKKTSLPSPTFADPRPSLLVRKSGGFLAFSKSFGNIFYHFLFHADLFAFNYRERQGGSKLEQLSHCSAELQQILVYKTSSGKKVQL